jgi:hypothetical protein
VQGPAEHLNNLFDHFRLLAHLSAALRGLGGSAANPCLRWQLRRRLQFVFVSSIEVKVFEQKKNMADILVRLISIVGEEP